MAAARSPPLSAPMNVRQRSRQPGNKLHYRQSKILSEFIDSYGLLSVSAHCRHHTSRCCLPDMGDVDDGMLERAAPPPAVLFAH
jgi:hypothetical protein